MKTPSEAYVQSFAYVRCQVCDRPHRLHSETYLTILGNLLVGSGGGLFGNGDWERHGVPVNHFCKECLVNEIEKVRV